MSKPDEKPEYQPTPARPLGSDPADADFLTTLVERSPAGICVVQNEHFAFVNQRLAEMYGGRPEDLVGRPFLDLVHPDDREVVQRRQRLRQIGEDQPLHYEVRALNADGSCVWLEVWPVLVDWGGGPAVMSTVLNIDWRKSAERALGHFTRELEERVRTATEHQRGAIQQLRLEIRERELAQGQLQRERDRAQLYLDVAQVALVAVDRGGRITLVNRRGVQLLGRSEEEILGADWFQRFAPNRQARIQRRFFLEIMEGRRQPTGYAETLVRDAQGNDLLVAWHYVVLWDREGNPSGVLGSGEDITESRRAHRELESRVGERTAELNQANQDLMESEAKFRAIFEQAPTGICHCSPDGRFLLVNPRLCELWGYSAEELCRLNIADVIHPQDLETTRSKARSLLGGEPGGYTLRKRYRRKDGSWHWGRATVCLARNAAGTPRYFIAVIEDLDQRPGEGHPAAGGERLAKLMDQAPFSLALYDSGGVMVRCNSAFVRMWQVKDLSAIVGRFNILKDPQAIKSGWADAVRRALAGETVDLPEVVFDPARSNEPGRKRIARSRAFPLNDSQGRVMGAVLTHEDITEQKALQQQGQMVSQVYEHSLEGIIIADSEGVVQMVNPAFSAITGYRPEEVVGRRMDLLRGEEHSDEFFENLWQALSTKGQWSGEYWNRRRNGEAYPEWLTLTVLRDPDGVISHYLAIFHDITVIKQGQEAIRFQAHHDALTGLPNRLLLDDRLNQALRQAQRKGCQVGVLFLDLDDFKRINDALGHSVGDGLLKKAAQLLLRCVRQVDTVARLGGDEFIVVVTEMDDASRVTRVARRILEHLKAPLEVAGHQLRARASLGISLYPADGQDAAALIKNADLAMYRAKQQGGDKYQMFTEVMQRQASRNLEMEAQLRAGLDREALTLSYQPRVELAGGRVIGAQARLGWISPEGKLLGPEAFLSVAEESGLIMPMGDLALSQACRDCRAWREDGHPDLRVALGLAPMQLERGSLAGRIRRVLADTGLPAGALELEISEADVIRDLARSLEVLPSLAALGVRIIISGFGGGLSSLPHLKSLPLHGLQVDRSLVRTMAEDPAEAALVRALVSLGHCLGLEVTADGVDDPRQSELLREAGCDQAQGENYGAPRPAGEFLAGLDPAAGAARPTGTGRRVRGRER